MKILTVGASPYLLVRNGRMNADLIRQLVADGHEVTSAVWHHDEGFFLPEEGGLHYFDDGDSGKRLCQLYPFFPQSTQADSVLYEIMKRIHPDVVISIGDYKDIDFIYSIKAMYPNIFKWIAVLPIDCLWVNENRRERLEYADYIVSTSEFGWTNVSNLCNVVGCFCPYGPNLDKFPFWARKPASAPVFMLSSQNSQNSNIGVFIKAMAIAKDILSLSGEGVVGKIHTNLYDSGDYDLDLLIGRYKATNVNLPSYFCSIRDGLSDDLFAQEYASADFFVDTSVKSATALTMLESMATGCIPIGMNYGRVGEVISALPKEYQIFVPFETFIGANEEEYAVMSVNGLADAVLRAKKDFASAPEHYRLASLAARKVAEQFSHKNFIHTMSAVTRNTASMVSSVAVETF